MFIADDLLFFDSVVGREKRASCSASLKIGLVLFKTFTQREERKMENGVHHRLEGKKGTQLFDSRKAHLPELRPDLVTALSGLYVDDFTVII